MTIAQRMYLLIASALVGLVGLAGLGVYQMDHVFTAANFGSVNTVPSLVALNEAYSSALIVRVRGWQYIISKDDARKAEFKKQIGDLNGTILKAIDKYEKEYLADAKDKALLTEERTATNEYIALTEKVIGMVDEGKNDEAADLFFTKADIGTRMAGAFKQHVQYNLELDKQGEDEARRGLTKATWINTGIAVVVVLFIAVMGLTITAKLVKSINEAVDVAQAVAGGDLRRNIVSESNDEIGKLLQALRDMNDSLKRIVGQVRSGTDAMLTASNEIASGNMDLSSRTESQASSLEETASSMEELTSTVKQNSDNASQANQLAKTASEVAAKGGSVVSEVVATMSSIDESSRKIVDIISVIDGIAFQTNILALNAAVEAARAGEQGRGFAVVAAEVRNLAQRSAAAAKEIKSLIGDSVEKVNAGGKLVDQAGATMGEVVQAIRQVTDIVAEISAASREQSQGIDQINQAVIEMDNATQQNAALVEQAAAAAGAMHDQAAQLSELVGVFKLDQGAMSAPRQAPRLAPAAATPSKSTAVAVKKEPRAVAPPRPRQPEHKAGDDWEEF
ncbi:MAG: MCP four helix bundle domain-containing protein [Burkholderiaceae bacterium]|nr:MCP four helix bundle domain-containing protein [Burkholderiaceae bacterium]